MFRLMFCSWIAGTMFMFHFANFMSMLRKHVRPGLFWFIRDIDDEAQQQHDPVKEMLQKPLVVVLPKIAVSFVIYVMIAWFLFAPLYLSVWLGWLDVRIVGNAGTYLSSDGVVKSEDNLAFGYIEWVVVYWACYLLALYAAQRSGMAKVYRKCIIRLFDRCVRLFRMRSVVYGGFWPEDVADDFHVECLNSVEYRQDGSRDPECTEEESFMLVLAQDKFVDIDLIREIYQIDSVKSPDIFEFEIAVHHLPTCDPELISAGYQVKPEFTPLRFSVSRQQNTFKVPILNSIRTWRDPIRIKMTHDEYKSLIGIQHRSDSRRSGEYEDDMFCLELDLDKKPMMVNVAVKYIAQNGEEATLKGTIIHKPRKLYLSVAKLVFTFLLAVSITHYTLFFGLLWSGRLLLGLFSYVISSRWFIPSDFGSVIVGLATFLALGQLVVPLYQFSKEHRHNRRVVYNLLFEFTDRDANNPDDMRDFAERCRVKLTAYHTENAIRIFKAYNSAVKDNLFSRNLRMECNLGKHSWAPFYWHDSFVTSTKSFLELIVKSLTFAAKWLFIFSALIVFIPIFSYDIFYIMVTRYLDFFSYIFSALRGRLTLESVIGAFDVESLTEVFQFRILKLDGVLFKFWDTILYPYQVKQLIRFFQINDAVWVRETYEHVFNLKFDRISLSSTVKLTLATVCGGLILVAAPMLTFGVAKHIVAPVFAVVGFDFESILTDAELLMICDRIFVSGILMIPLLNWAFKGLVFLKEQIIKMIAKSEQLETREIMDLDDFARERLRQQSIASQQSPTSANVEQRPAEPGQRINIE